MTTASATELSGLFQQELAVVHDDVRRQAALAAFARLRPSNHITVEKFLEGLGSHKDIWEAVRSLGIVDFAAAVAGQRAAAPAPQARRRTRISDEQKNTLKDAIVRVLQGQAQGLSRVELTDAISAAGLQPPGIEQAVLAEKVRQPLHELVAAGKLHTVGEKRLMKYVPGAR